MLASRDHLLASHEAFRKLAQEHTQYEQRLSSLTHKRFLTDDEKLEEVRLKKLKLRLKDQMESIERQYRKILSFHLCTERHRIDVSSGAGAETGSLASAGCNIIATIHGS